VENESEQQLFQGAVSLPLPPLAATDSPTYLSESSSDSDAPSTPRTDPQVHELIGKLELESGLSDEDVPKASGGRRASTVLISQDDDQVRRILGGEHDGTALVEKVCCGGGCCQMQALAVDQTSCYEPVTIPDNDAFRSLQLQLGPLSLSSELTNIIDLPPQTISFLPLPSATKIPESTVEYHPPHFVMPHYPFTVYSSRLHHVRELTKPGAEKRTYHFDLDVTDYPAEGGSVDFVVGGAIGICAPNEAHTVDEILYLLLIPRVLRDRPVLLKTEGSRWPTIWGDEQARELATTRRELLTWCVDIQSSAPTKPLLRLLAEYAVEENEKKILTFLSSAQGQGAFCE
jgi:FAD binding domain